MKNPQVPQAKDVTSSSANTVALAEVASSSVEIKIPPSFVILSEEAHKSEKAVKNASDILQATKEKLFSHYTEEGKKKDEIAKVIEGIETGNFDEKPINCKYFDAFKNWKDADQVNKINETNLKKY